MRPRARLKPFRYHATLSGAGWKRGPTASFRTIREAREWAEEYGTTADRCVIRDTQCSQMIGAHVRDPSTNRWFRATP